MISQKINLKDLSRESLHAFFENQGLPKYRAGQLIRWMYDKYATNIDMISEFSKELRSRLNDIAYISTLKVLERQQSSDGAEKFLFELEDGHTIEAVYIPEEDRATLCVSSQAGCAMGCRFCLTGMLGLARDLHAYEIVDQIVTVNRLVFPGKVNNLVFMGMGEPLANFDQVVDALWKIVDFIGISKRRINVSTAGIVPKIPLFHTHAPEVNLAVSLNAATDQSRSELMPVNKKYPMISLIEACRKYPLGKGRKITFEYVIIDGKNSSPEDALKLGRLLRGIRCKVNLIPLNPFPGSDLKPPADEGILTFQDILVKNGIMTFIRRSRGRDILAACGQLKAGHTEKKKGGIRILPPTR